MCPDTFELETNLDEHAFSRLHRALAEANVSAHVDVGSVVFDDPHFGRQVQVWLERLIDYNFRIHQAAKREGKPLSRYKPRDEVNLIVAVCLGLQAGRNAAIVHEVVWRQPFPNANHRTAIAALIDELDVTVGMDDLRTVTDPFITESKGLLDGSDRSRTDKEAKQAHHELMVRLVEELQSIK